MEILFWRGMLLIFCTVFNLVLAFLLFTKRKENKPAFHLGFTALFSALFCFTCAMTDFLWESPFSYSTKLFWTKSTWLGTLILPAYLTFVYYFTRKTRHIELRSFLWYLGAGIISFLALSTSYFVSSVQIESLEIFARPGKLEPLGRVYIIFAIIIGLIYLLREYFQSKGFRKLQIKYLILGFLIYSIGGIIFTGILPFLQDKTGPYVDITALLSFFWVGLTSYAIIRYRLMDIRIALGKAMVFILSFLTIVYFSFLIIFINRQLPASLPFTTLILLALLLLILLSKLIEFYEKLAEMYFYPGFAKRRFILSSLKQDLAYLLEMETFSSLIAESLNKAFGLKKIAILTKIARKEGYNLQKISGFEKNQITKLSKNEFFLSLLKRIKKPFGTQEILVLLQKAKIKEEIGKLKKLRQKFKNTGIEFLLPLLFERKVIGIIFLGEKVSGEAFSIEDVDLLTNLSRQTSIALRNTLLYSEVKKRKEELERFYKLTVDKEIKILELRKKILELEEGLGEKEK